MNALNWITTSRAKQAVPKGTGNGASSELFVTNLIRHAQKERQGMKDRCRSWNDISEVRSECAASSRGLVMILRERARAQWQLVMHVPILGWGKIPKRSFHGFKRIRHKRLPSMPLATIMYLYLCEVRWYIIKGID